MYTTPFLDAHMGTEHARTKRCGGNRGDNHRRIDAITETLF